MSIMSAKNFVTFTSRICIPIASLLWLRDAYDDNELRLRTLLLVVVVVVACYGGLASFRQTFIGLRFCNCKFDDNYSYLIVFDTSVTW